MDFRSTDGQREILALSFEPNGDGYIYYRNRWSRGIPVTAAEREAYLRIPAFGSRRAWRASITGRETLPPRAYGPTGRKLWAAMPWRMAVFGILFGIVFLIGGVAGLQTPHTTQALLWALLSIVAGALMLASGISIALARIPRRRIG